MKRRATIVTAAVAVLTVGGLSVADASTPSTSLGRDTSGCIVLLPNAARPLTICLFPR